MLLLPPPSLASTRLAFCSPVSTSLYLYHHRLDNPGLKRTETASEGLRNPRGYAISGDHSLGTSPDTPPNTYYKLG